MKVGVRKAGAIVVEDNGAMAFATRDALERQSAAWAEGMKVGARARAVAVVAAAGAEVVDGVAMDKLTRAMEVKDA